VQKPQWQLDTLERYHIGCYGSLPRPKARPTCLSFDVFLSAARGLADQKTEWMSYAARLKTETTRSNPWIAEALQMGAHASISRYMTEFRFGQRTAATACFNKISNG
jgi:hypothetical protein